MRQLDVGGRASRSRHDRPQAVLSAISPVRVSLVSPICFLIICAIWSLIFCCWAGGNALNWSSVRPSLASISACSRCAGVMLAHCSNCRAAVFAGLALRVVELEADVAAGAAELDDPAGTFDDAG